MRIFNRIRRKLLDDLKIKSYFFYALGEVLLIVIGILIALQINNWNEQRKNLSSEQRVLINLQETFLVNQIEIEFSTNEFKTIKDNLVLRILKTGPCVELPPDSILIALSKIGMETLSLAYDGVNKQLSQSQLSLLSSETLRDELSAFSITLARYRSTENYVHNLALELRKIHQDYVSILNKDISKSSAGLETTQEQFSSDYLGWLRDRDHQNKAVECKRKVERCIAELKELYVHNQKILEVIEQQIKDALLFKRLKNKSLEVIS